MIITDQTRAQAIVQTFSDENSKKIILCTNSGSRSIEEISEEAGIPMSTCYRKMRTLLDAGFIRLERSNSVPYGKEHDCYRSTFSNLAIRIENGSLIVEVDSQVLNQSCEAPLLVTPTLRS